MKERFFKPGDRVQRISGGPVMTVQRYAWKKNLLLGWHRSTTAVECTWLAPEGYKKDIIHQNHLKRASSRTSRVGYSYHQSSKEKMSWAS